MKQFLFLGALGLAACSNATQTTANTAGESMILSEAAVATDAADWGSFLPYFTEDTHVLKPVLVGVAKIDAGQQIHPPHRHADEEYLMVTKGRGEWYLNGKTMPAKEGDILFARAWDYHGVKAADDSPLEFVVFKYSGKTGSSPTDPEPELPEELVE
jgi:quercetin dioxygenase-like cupin family protein